MAAIPSSSSPAAKARLAVANSAISMGNQCITIGPAVPLSAAPTAVSEAALAAPAAARASLELDPSLGVAAPAVKILPHTCPLPSARPEPRDFHAESEAPTTAAVESVLSQDQAFERIGNAVRSNLQQINDNLAQARKQSDQFFNLTRIFASLGFLVVLIAVIFLLFSRVTEGIVSSISSLIPTVISVIFFRKDRELKDIIAKYHQHILESQKILTMIDVAETLTSAKEKDKIKQIIICNGLGINNINIQP